MALQKRPFQRHCHLIKTQVALTWALLFFQPKIEENTKRLEKTETFFKKLSHFQEKKTLRNLSKNWAHQRFGHRKHPEFCQKKPKKGPIETSSENEPVIGDWGA